MCDEESAATLPFELVDRIVEQIRKLFERKRIISVNFFKTQNDIKTHGRTLSNFTETLPCLDQWFLARFYSQIAIWATDYCQFFFDRTIFYETLMMIPVNSFVVQLLQVREFLCWFDTVQKVYVRCQKVRYILLKWIDDFQCINFFLQNERNFNWLVKMEWKIVQAYNNEDWTKNFKFW